MDLCASARGVPLGHGHQIVRSAVERSLKLGLEGRLPAEMAFEVCREAQASIAGPGDGPGNSVACLFGSGEEALFAALQVAKGHTGRRKVAVVSAARHGRPLGQVSFGLGPPGRATDNRGLGEVIYIPFPGAWGSPIADTAGFGSFLVDYIFPCVAHPYEIAALVVPPVEFCEGLAVLPEDFFETVSQICSQTGIVLVVDETKLGIGVCGTRFAAQMWDSQPGIDCLGEGFCNGLAFGADVVPTGMLDFDRDWVAGQLGCHPLSCAVASALFEQREEFWADQVARIEAILSERLNLLRDSCDLVDAVEGRGVLWALRLVNGPSRFKDYLNLRDQVVGAMLSHDILLCKTGRNSLIIAPPLIASDDEIKEALGVLAQVLSEAG